MTGLRSLGWTVPLVRSTPRVIVYPLLSAFRVHHAPTDSRRVRALTTSMRARGWLGRPILAEAISGGRLQAWTASHRITAARRAKTVPHPPTLLVDREKLAAHMKRCGFPVGEVLLFGLPPRWYDNDRVAFLRAAGDTFAATLLGEEAAANRRDENAREWVRRGQWARTATRRP